VLITERSPLKDRRPPGVRETLEVIGVDPSILTGIAHIRILVDGRVSVLNLKTLEFPSIARNETASISLAVAEYAAALAEFIDDWITAPVAIEQPFGGGKNLEGYGCHMLIVGGIQTLLAQKGIRTVAIQPQRTKSALCDNPYASKAQMIMAAKLLPNAAEQMDWKRLKHREAQADAIGVALAAARILRSA
jgi:Holliday junction resolvasome RuvABC endonuclease subunit